MKTISNPVSPRIKGNIIQEPGYDWSMFQTFKKDPKKRKRNKLSKKSRKRNR